MPDAAAQEMEAGFEAYDANRFDDASSRFRAALTAGADPVMALTNLGAALNGMGRPHAAAACQSRALALDPKSAESWGGRGAARLSCGMIESGVEDLSRAIELDPTEALYRRNLGFALMAAKRPEQALEAFDAGLKVAPGDAYLEFHRSGALLQLGRYEEAWPGYDRRFEIGDFDRRKPTAPLWDGAPLKGGRLLLFAEQGHGDMIQFARFLPEALRRARGEVFLETHPSLVRFFAANFPEVDVFAVGEPEPPHDLRLPFTSIAGLVGGLPTTGLEKNGAYLCAPNPTERPKGQPGLRVGLVWKGRPRPWDRSCPLPLLLSLAEVPGVSLISLQRDGAGDIEAVGAGTLVEDATAQLFDFADDAAFVATLDLVISTDTSTCHFAGALGRPVWTLLTNRTDWRYPVEGDRTPWYPTMRLFRQARSGDWRAPIEEICTALTGLAA